jgi:hypothetical protein
MPVKSEADLFSKRCRNNLVILFDRCGSKQNKNKQTREKKTTKPQTAAESQMLSAYCRYGFCTLIHPEHGIIKHII